MFKIFNGSSVNKFFSKDTQINKGQEYKAIVLKKIDNTNFIIKIKDFLFFKVKLPDFINENDIIKLKLLERNPKYKFKFIQKINSDIIDNIKKNFVKEDHLIFKDKDFSLFNNITKEKKEILKLISENNYNNLKNIFKSENYNNFIYFISNNNFFIPFKIDDFDFFCKIKREKDYDIIKIAFFFDNDYYINTLIYKDKKRLIINFFSNYKGLLAFIEKKKDLLLNKKRINPEKNKIKVDVKFYYEKV